jgi:hypothetical protein
VERALDKTDQKLIRLMSKRVGVALRHQQDAGRVRSVLDPGQYNLWEMVRDHGRAHDDKVATFPPRRRFTPGVRKASRARVISAESFGDSQRSSSLIQGAG